MKIVGTTRKDYPSVLIDTGAFKTGIPFTDCIELGLTYVGVHGASGLFGSDDLPVFECKMVFDDGEIYDSLQVLGLPMEYALIGRDILSNYRLVIDWVAQIATAERASSADS